MKTDSLQTLIDATPDGEVCRLAKKEYFLNERVVLRGRKGLTLDGNGAVLVTRYHSNKSYHHSVDALLLEACEDVTLCNLQFDTDVAPNFPATVEEIDHENTAIVIRAHTPVRGDEVLMSLISYENGIPDSRLCHYARHPDPTVLTVIQDEIYCANTFAGAKHDYLGENRFRVFFPKPVYLEKAHIGQMLCVRHTMYGPATLTLRGCRNTTLRDLHFRAVPGFAVLVLPRCENLTIERLQIKPTRGMLMGGNCDGVHITGLTGHLSMKNCCFEGLGDDALNLHSTAGTVTAAEGEQLRLHYCKKKADGLLPAAWCRSGDRIAFYHPETMQKEAVAEVLSFCGADLKFRSIHGVPQPGMIALNTAFLPSSRITECTVRRSRGKGILLQSGNAEIDHCAFADLTHPAVRVAPAFVKWFEVGPCENLDLHDNRIENCCIATPEIAAVTVSTSHGVNDPTVQGLHKNIRIRNNTFVRMQKCIFVSSADGVQIKNNVLPSPDGIETVSCTDLLIE